MSVFGDTITIGGKADAARKANSGGCGTKLTWPSGWRCLLSGVFRKSRFGVVRSEFDPYATFSVAEIRSLLGAQR
jgi:hypothetical protein